MSQPAHHQVYGPPAPPPVPEAELQLDQALVPDLVRALCTATGRGRFAMSPDVAGSGSRLTVALAGTADEVWQDGVQALRLAGFDASCAKGLCRFFTLEVPPAPPVVVPQAVLTYEPQYRDVAFLASQAASLVTGWHFSGAGAGAAGGQAAAVAAAVSPASGSGSSGASGSAAHLESVPARLVGLGPAADRKRVEEVLRQLDRPVAALVVRVAVFEVDTSSVEQSAINLVANIAAHALNSTATVGQAGASAVPIAGGYGITFSYQGFSAVLSALDTSSVAHLVTSPVLRTSSGVIASFAVGDSVPTVGSVSYTQGSSTPVQSIQYQQSGVVFSVVPVLIGQQVDVALYQSVSSFSATTVGVTSSPTLQNRVLSSDLVLRPGEVVMLGGLMQTNDTKGTAGWWVFPKLSHNDQASRSELVLMLSVDLASE